MAPAAVHGLYRAWPIWRLRLKPGVANVCPGHGCREHRPRARRRPAGPPKLSRLELRGAPSIAYNHGCHEEPSSWKCGLAIVALTSAIASLSFPWPDPGACEAAASPGTHSHKKAHSHHPQLTLGDGRLCLQETAGKGVCQDHAGDHHTSGLKRQRVAHHCL